MKHLILVLLFSLFCTPANAGSEKFVTFPALGFCTGKYVRYRDNPDTEGEILGRLNSPERVIVLNQTVTDGDLWYEIEDPHSENTAFVFGKYIEPVYDETSQQGEPYKMMVSVIQTYGLTQERSKLYNGPKVNITHKAPFKIEAFNKGCSFGDVSIGDNTMKLREVLGEPDILTDSQWEYRIEVDTILEFRLKDGKIERMIFEE
ncbi:MAG: SH3 domain-containing protein [Synergistaceae bacterium]|nr:SH3 domain-containing protein [Synergistaceae bacterium]